MDTAMREGDETDEQIYLPSQDEIRRMCSAIQQAWSERERQRRIVGWKPSRYSIPTVKDHSEIRLWR